MVPMLNRWDGQCNRENTSLMFHHKTFTTFAIRSYPPQDSWTCVRCDERQKRDNSLDFIYLCNFFFRFVLATECVCCCCWPFSLLHRWYNFRIERNKNKNKNNGLELAWAKHKMKQWEGERVWDENCAGVTGENERVWGSASLVVCEMQTKI